MAIRAIVRGNEEIVRRFSNTTGRLALWRAHLERETGLIWGAVVPLTPVGVTAVLRGAWATEVHVGPGAVRGIVGNPQVHAEPIERGRRPGARMPPPDAIATWVSRKMGPEVSPFVVARSIGQKGIQPRRMLERAVKVTLPIRLSLRAQLMANLLERS